MRERALVAVLGLQWAAVVVPAAAPLILVTGEALGLRGAEAESHLARSLLFVALFTLGQVTVGHRLPAFEGPASVTLAAVLVATQAGPADPLAAVGGGLLVSGAVLAALGGTGALRPLLRAYTPLVNGTFLVVLAATVGWTLLPDAVSPTGTSPGIARVALMVVLGTPLVLGALGPPGLRATSFLLGFLGGLAVFALAGEVHAVPAPGGLGLDLVRPAFDPGVAVPLGAAAFLVALNSLSTGVAVAQAAGEAGAGPFTGRGLLVTAASHAVQGIVPGVGTVPHTESASLVARRPELARSSLIVGALIVGGAALLPPARAFLVGLPSPLSRDMVLAVMATMALIGVQQLRRVRWSKIRVAVFAASLGAAWLLLPGPGDGVPAGLRPFVPGPVPVAVAVALAGEALHHRGSARGRSWFDR